MASWHDVVDFGTRQVDQAEPRPAFLRPAAHASAAARPNALPPARTIASTASTSCAGQQVCLDASGAPPSNAHRRHDGLVGRKSPWAVRTDHILCPARLMPGTVRYQFFAPGLAIMSALMSFIRTPCSIGQPDTAQAKGFFRFRSLSRLPARSVALAMPCPCGALRWPPARGQRQCDFPPAEAAQGAGRPPKRWSPPLGANLSWTKGAMSRCGQHRCAVEGPAWKYWAMGGNAIECRQCRFMPVLGLSNGKSGLVAAVHGLLRPPQD